MSDPIEQIKAVSHRNHFPSIEELAMLYSGGDDVLKAHLMQFGRNLLSSTSFAFAKACQSAIDQAVELIEDPNYYETRKRRHAQNRKRETEKHTSEKKQKLLEEYDPEAIFKKRAQQISRLEQMIRYHKDQLEATQKEHTNLLAGVVARPIEPKPRGDWDGIGV